MHFVCKEEEERNAAMAYPISQEEYDTVKAEAAKELKEKTKAINDLQMRNLEVTSLQEQLALMATQLEAQQSTALKRSTFSLSEFVEALIRMAMATPASCLALA